MSIKHSMRNFRKPIGTGYFRNAYYSKKYDVVVKMPHGNHTKEGMQTAEREYEFYNELPEEHKKYFPVVGIEYHKGYSCLLMKRVNTFPYAAENIICKCGDSSKYLDMKSEEQLLIIANEFLLEFGVTFDAKEIYELIDKYRLDDLHYENIGHIDGQFVFIDWLIDFTFQRAREDK